MSMSRIFSIILTLLLCCVLSAPAVGQTGTAGSDRLSCPQVKIEVERWPDLNIPRANHHTFCLNGEVVVMGGHTSGFVPTATAEYYSQGRWHVVPMVYPHDDGMAVALDGGRKVLLAGGHQQELGIGQTFTMEMYDAERHTSEGFGCLDRKRVMASGAEIDSGHVVIAGNWYHEDGIEVFDGHPLLTAAKDVAQQRNKPFVFRSDRDNALVFGTGTPDGSRNDTIVVDRLHGEPFTPALFTTWKPLYMHMNMHGSESFIGDEAAGRYAYLFPVSRADGQVAIARVQGEQFDLLPTVCPVPMKSRLGPLQWISPVIADRQAQRAYMLGGSTDSLHILYVLCIDYAKTPAPLTLCYTDPLPDVGLPTPVLTAEGHLLMAGGRQDSNFYPFASVCLLRVGNRPDSPSQTAWGWLWGLAALVLVALAVMAAIAYRRRSASVAPAPQELPVQDTLSLMQRINELMEQQQLYLRSDLKVSDVAAALGVNRREVSECVTAQYDGSFAQLVNGYRVEHAKRLMRTNPDIKIAVVCTESGFANETSFFRTFKSFTGMTPKEWIGQDSQ